MAWEERKRVVRLGNVGESRRRTRSAPILVGAWLLVSAVILGAVEGPPCESAEPDGLKAAAAIQDVMVAAIAASEKSVVAVARLRKGRPEAKPGESPGRLFQPPFPSGFLTDASPLSPDFIPNEFGAGVVVDAAGLILTNYHVLGDTENSSFFVWSAHRPFAAAVIAADPWFDLAVLRVEATQLIPIRFGDATQLRKGQIVIALGNPYAIARDGEVSASWGIISNLLRRAPPTPGSSRDPSARETIHHYGTLIQTDARLNLGFSGGALVNLRGEMIGLTNSYAAGPDVETAAGFAVPVDDHFRRTVETLKAGGRPAFGFLGVGPEPLSDELRRQGKHGTRVMSVVEGTPAAIAGLRPGDVITHVNQQPVHDDDDLFRMVGQLAPGAAVMLRVARGDIENPNTPILERTVTLTKKSVASRRPPIAQIPIPQWRGMSVDYATAAPSFSDVGPQLDPRGCVYVVSVVRDSAAWKAGLRSGVFVSHAGGKRTVTPDGFFAAVTGVDGEVELRVLTGQGPARQYSVSP